MDSKPLTYQKVSVVCSTSGVLNRNGLSVMLQLGWKSHSDKFMCWVRHPSDVTSDSVREDPVGGQLRVGSTGFRQVWSDSMPLLATPRVSTSASPARTLPPCPLVDASCETSPSREAPGTGLVRDSGRWLTRWPFPAGVRGVSPLSEGMRSLSAAAGKRTWGWVSLPSCLLVHVPSLTKS